MSIDLMTIVGNTFSTTCEWDGNKTRHWCVRLTLLTKYSHKWTKPCSPYKYTRPDFQETFVVAHYAICKYLKTQKNLWLQC